MKTEAILEDLHLVATQGDLLRIARAAIERAQGLESDERKVTMTDAQLDQALDILRARGVWGEKNDRSLAGLVASGATRQGAFRTLTDGSPVVRDVVLAVFEDCPIEAEPTPEPEPESEPEPPVTVVEPEEPALPQRRRRGRPRLSD
jgi:hypothetical protein